MLFSLWRDIYWSITKQEWNAYNILTAQMLHANAIYQHSQISPRSKQFFFGKFMQIYKNWFTFWIPIPQYNNFISGGCCSPWLGQIWKEIASKKVGWDISIGNSSSLNSTADLSLDSKCWLCWLNSMDAIHIVSKLRGKESLNNVQHFQSSSISFIKYS